MARGKETTPLDEISGMPLPIYVRRSSYLFNDVNFHHAFHPKKDIDLGYIPSDERETADPGLVEFLNMLELEGKAVRFSRGQDLPLSIHNRYHNTFIGPELPKSTDSKFKTVVLALSGIVPRQAIHIPKRGDYEIKDLSDREFRFIADRSRMHYEDAHSPFAAASKRQWIGKFFANYAIEKSLADVVTEDLIAEFLDPRSTEERVGQLGRKMIVAAADESFEPIRPLFLEAKREGLLVNPKTRPKYIVRRYIGSISFNTYESNLRQTLESALA